MHSARSRIAAGLLAILACGAAGCDALWGGLQGDNPKNCAFNRTACGPGEICDAETQTCRADVQITGIEPALAPTRAAVQLSLSGRGLAPGSRVLFDGQPIEGAQILSDTRLTFQAPARPGGPLRPSIGIEHPSGVRVRRSDLFSYYATELRLSMMYVGTNLVPSSLGMADLNGDGRDDAVVVEASSRRILSFLAQPDGSLAGTPLPVTLPAGLSAGSLALADVNGDLIPDAVVNGGKSLVRMRGDGKGQFGEPLLISDTYDQHALADLDGDGRIDIVAMSGVGTGAGQRLFLHRGLGDGSFLPRSELAPTVKSIFFTLADFDQDGLLDMACSLEASNEVVVLSHDRGRLDPGSLRLRTITSAACAQGPALSVHARDFTGDGLPDVLVGCQREVSLLRNSRGGTFEPIPISLSNWQVQQIHPVDLDGDRRFDAAVCMADPADMHVEVRILQSGPQGLTLHPIAPLSQLSRASCVFGSGDTSGDGLPEVVFGSRTGELPSTAFLRNGSQ